MISSYIWNTSAQSAASGLTAELINELTVGITCRKQIHLRPSAYLQKKKKKNPILFLWKWHHMVTGITETIY